MARPTSSAYTAESYGYHGADDRSLAPSSLGLGAGTNDLEGAPAVRSTKATSHLSLDIFTDSTFVVSGSTLSGHLEIRSTANPKHLGLRSITLELVGQEVVTGGAFGVCDRVFLRRMLVIQSPELPPCDAVLVGAELSTAALGTANQEGYWRAKKGTTRLQFAFVLPETLPCCVASKAGSVTYTLTA